MDFYKLFYFLTLGDRLSSFFFYTALGLSIVYVILFLVRILSEDDFFSSVFTNKKGDKYFLEKEDGSLAPSSYNVGKSIYVATAAGVRVSKVSNISFIGACLLWLMYIAIPSKKDAVLIIGGGYVGNFITQDSSARQLPSDIVYFIRTNLQKYAEEAQVEIRGFTNTKTLADSLAEMSKEEMANYILNKNK